MLDWLIVGGGIHGTLVAHALLKHGYADPLRTRILDPNPRLLAEWKRRSHACGMRYLRSPAAHALVPDFTALLGWATQHGYDRDEHTIPPYARPSLELFNAHADAALAELQLDRVHLPRRAVSIARNGNSWSLTSDDASELEARRIVLAPGRAPGLLVPPWASGCDASIVHVFDPRFDRRAAEDARAPLIVGGGVTAAHLALHLVSHGRRPRLLVRDKIRVHQFDSDPCFIGPACMERFLAESDPGRRRELLAGARHPGSVPPELAAQIDDAVEADQLELLSAEVLETERVDPHTICVSGRHGQWYADIVVLATGFTAAPPGGRLRSALASGEATGAPLPVDKAGFPIPGPSLEWDRGLYVTGALAEQELGPAAGNIVGAHNAAKRIIADLSGRPRQVPGAWRRYS